MKFCRAPFEDMYISSNYVKVCPWMAMDTVLGNPLESSLDELWNGEKAELVRDSIRDGSFRYCNKETCPRCASAELEEIDDEIGKNYKAEPFAKKMNVSYDRFCNHICPSCRDKFFVPNDEYKEKMKRLKEAVLPFANKTQTLTTCGMGDCFSSPFMMEFLRELQPENPDFHISFETNGVFIDEKHWAEIAHLHKYSINFTITPNSFEKYTYRYLSGGIDDLEKCKKSIKFVSNLRKEGKITSFKINMVVQESNYWEIPQFVKFCLEEYDPDLIQIKPINRWFCLNAEGYWFKNVLNPKHPYHKNYLAVMEEPILKHPKVRDWTSESHDRDSRLHPSVYSEIYVDLLRKLVVDDGFKNSIKNKLRELNVENVAIYGAYKYGEVCNEILADVENVSVKYFIDKKWGAKGKKCQNLDIKALHNEDFSDVDTIFISVLASKEEIMRDLNIVGYEGNVITIKDLL